MTSCLWPAACQDMEPFESPKVQLEQYPTGADIASRMLYTVSWAPSGFMQDLVYLGCGHVQSLVCTAGLQPGTQLQPANGGQPQSV
jgi:predicted RNA methylase